MTFLPLDRRDDHMDSRELEDRISELEAERDDATEEWQLARTQLYAAEHAEEPDADEVGRLRDEVEQTLNVVAGWNDSEEGEELDALLQLRDECAGMGWEYGIHFVADYAFEDYAQQTAEDIGAIDPDASWPLSYIDWEAAADALRMDYTSVQFRGTTYYCREA